MCRSSAEKLAEVLDGTNHLAGVGVLVVIPGNNLNLGCAVVKRQNHGLSGIKQRTEAHANDIAGYDLIYVVAEGLVGSSLHSSSADELAVQLRDNKADSLSCACAVGNDVDSCCAGSSLVTLSLRSVKSHLIAGVSVDRAHDTSLDGSQIIKSLSHRSQAVGCAGCSGDDLIFACKALVVYVVNDCRKVISCRSGDDNVLSACIDMSLCLSLGGIEACALQNYVNADLAPRKLSCVSLSIDLDILAINSDEIFACRDGVSLLISSLSTISNPSAPNI